MPALRCLIWWLLVIPVWLSLVCLYLAWTAAKGLYNLCCWLDGRPNLMSFREYWEYLNDLSA